MITPHESKQYSNLCFQTTAGIPKYSEPFYTRIKDQLDTQKFFFFNTVRVSDLALTSSGIPLSIIASSAPHGFHLNKVLPCNCLFLRGILPTTIPS